MTWVLVELAEGHGYDVEESLYTYKEIGEVFGPFATIEEAKACGKEINDNRGHYTYLGRKRRMDMRDFEAIELVKPT